LLKLAYAFAWIFLGFRVRGREHLPEKGPFLLCPNHESYLDAFLLVSALPYRLLKHLFFVGASEYFDTAFTGWLARLMNVVPVDPDTNLIRAMQAGAFGLRHGKILILFPEGERTIDGEIKKFKKGAPILSLNLDVPIVPVALENVFEIWPRSRSISWGSMFPGSSSRAHARIAFGEPINFSDEDFAGAGAQNAAPERGARPGCDILAPAAKESKAQPRSSAAEKTKRDAAAEAAGQEEGRTATAVATAPPPPPNDDRYSLAAEKLRSIVVSLQESLRSQ
jgi:1-acyl-sn-glycerol-3-phosphate acyltransferase